ncbi:MAG: TetR/AcrR family transcriptional regulator [Actinomycetota bacterium]
MVDTKTRTKPLSRDTILDRAEELFAQRGYAGIGIAEVAEGAGLSKSSLFHHFPSKARLYTAVMARILTHLDDELTSSLAQGGRPTERLDRWIDTVIDVLTTNPTYPGLLLRVLVDDADLPSGLPDGKVAHDTIRRIGANAIRLLREGMDEVEFRRTSAAYTLQMLFAATVHPLATGRFGDELIGKPMFSSAEIARRKREVKAMFHHGLVQKEARR